MPRIFIVSIFIILAFSSCGHSYYIVRHAEKAMAEPNMSSDVPLTDEGKREPGR
ncbi:MAG: hypothetical protein WDO16_22605 [Bacteroidota bacterium]